ncbi:hypothetical protein HJG60_010405 [Phyllostomus discolor]|uniref:Uncharacterized protein n=1 Tax=Phyllostomus discolor TaxID=89673 RepID=A0A834EKC7_9CHIR|nr:hypothetical protein HJG60_010405 [Phyllostomus discolor]
MEMTTPTWGLSSANVGLSEKVGCPLQCPQEAPGCGCSSPQAREPAPGRGERAEGGVRPLIADRLISGGRASHHTCSVWVLTYSHLSLLSSSASPGKIKGEAQSEPTSSSRESTPPTVHPGNVGRRRCVPRDEALFVVLTTLFSVRADAVTPRGDGSEENEVSFQRQSHGRH